ncbi:MAG: DUF4143 domain-containing protein [Legionellaceae bacterium]
MQTKSPRGQQIWFKFYLEGRLLNDFENLYHARGDYHSKIKALTTYLAGLSGHLLKYANVSNDLGIDDKLIKTYIEILELMSIVKRLPAYLKNKSKSLAITVPKLHLVDTGLACFLLGIKTQEQLVLSPHYGGLLETFIYMEFIKHSEWSMDPVSIYHFRDKQKSEVDLILERNDGKLWAIEIKASSTVTPDDFRNIAKFSAFAGSLFLGGIVFYSGHTVLTFSKNKTPLYALPIGLFI